MPQKQIGWFGRKVTLRCDGRCDKAWGINNRPRVQFDATDPDDYAFLADGELGTAPEDPGTYEGGHGKPSALPLAEGFAEQMNKWCSRECERSCLVEANGNGPSLPDFAQRLRNKPAKGGE